MKKAHELGFMNCGVPSKYGGLGLSCFDVCMLNEEIAYGCSGIGLAIGGNGLAVIIF